ncbi:MAG: hypothetical protein A2X78_00440 [Gammaproteobacteria bacterium GWE2_37_16]|nr:MAG: hypothetical protein A2X78_00440 [Gammaproteobacteria bacterium GWE2_37_16]
MLKEYTKTRNTVRALVFNDQDQILLMQLRVPSNDMLKTDRIFWITLGGEIEGNETPTETLFRELKEEGGIIQVRSFSLIGNSDQVLQWRNESTRLTEQFFGVRVDEVNLGQVSLTDEEKLFLIKYQWWNIDDLVQTDEVFYPKNLVFLARDYLKIFF